MKSVPSARVPRSPAGPVRARAGAGERVASQTILRLQASAGNRATAALLQRVLKPPVFDKAPDWLKPVAEAYNTLRTAVPGWGLFNSAARSAARQKALIKLGQVERAVYEWFGEHGGRDRDAMADPEWAAMREFLNQLQDERIGLVELALDDGGVPPLANFDQLAEEEQQVVRGIWADLVSKKDERSKTGIDIQGPKAARIRILADFSRLLETATGRMVVGGLSGDRPKLTITPSSKAKAKFAASPVDEALEGLLAVEQPGSGEQFVSLNLSKASVLERKLAINDVRVSNPKADGVSVIMDGVTRHFSFNKGTASTVTVPEGARDTAAKPWSLAIGVADEAIIAPTFVNLGHELGHALRALHGIVAKKDETSTTLLGHAFHGVKSELRPEEFFNIDAIENRIRRDAHLALRGAHEDWVGREVLRMFNALETVEKTAKRALDLAPDALKPDIKRLEAQRSELTTALQELQASGSTDIGGLRTRAVALGREAAALEERAKRAQEPGKETPPQPSSPPPASVPAEKERESGERPKVPEPVVLGSVAQLQAVAANPALFTFLDGLDPGWEVPAAPQPDGDQGMIVGQGRGVMLGAAGKAKQAAPVPGEIRLPDQLGFLTNNGSGALCFVYSVVMGLTGRPQGEVEGTVARISMAAGLHEGWIASDSDEARRVLAAAEQVFGIPIQVIEVQNSVAGLIISGRSHNATRGARRVVVLRNTGAHYDAVV